MLPPLIRRLLSALTFVTGLASSSVFAAQPLKLDVYNPGADAFFPVTSVLVSGEKDAILIDAQFGTTQAAQLVEKVRQSGKRLTTIYISHGDPDYYFGLQTLTRAFPQAKVVASAPTVAHIEKTKADKLAFWGKTLPAQVPSAVIVPQVLAGGALELEGHALQIIGLDGPQSDRTFVWIPSLKAVLGGVVLANNIHVWMADTQSSESHRAWLATLATIDRLGPRIVIPGHFLPGSGDALQAATFTANYIRDFDRQTPLAEDSAQLISAMKALYPDLGEEGSLELSAKVAKGEMQW